MFCCELLHGVESALQDIWPTTDRRFCCRHLSRNFKKKFPGPFYVHFILDTANATNPFTFRKAMERLQKEGGEEVMTLLAYLGNQSR